MLVDIYTIPSGSGDFVIIDKFNFAKHEGRHTFFDENDANILLNKGCILYTGKTHIYSKYIAALKDGFKFPFDVQSCEMTDDELTLWIELHDLKIFKENQLWVF